MTITARVRKHREKLRRAQCRRFEVWIGEGVIEDIRHLAKVTHRATWDVVEEALEAYAADRTKTMVHTVEVLPVTLSGI
ncbi:MAG TPA: hypothetical protein VJT11_04135 [Nitrospiraceae bacterium]|nr:hypothetical protein [Nitrospiraceae bacterium]